MSKKLLSFFLLTALFTLTFSGCSSSSDSKEHATHSETTIESTSNAPSEIKLIDVTLNEVAHSIFYAPMYVAIENGYFEEEGINLDLVCGYGADKVMTAVLSGEADIGFMGSESSIYTYAEGAKDYVVNFAQLTQRAGNFLVSRENISDFSWDDLKGSYVLGGRKGVAHQSM
ncbi:MAG: ABC transporter substrate-binding protein [Schaedlerella sp.]|nr:ABC transporter substrate-binding protein [Schaedlerella sp.]